MRKLGYVIAACTLTLLLAACSGNKTPGGVKYEVLKKGNGTQVATDKILVIDILMKDSKDSIWFNSQTGEFPAMARFPETFKEDDPGEYGVYRSLSKGDCVTFKLPVSTVFVKTRGLQVPPKVDPESPISFTVNIKEVLTKDEAKEFRNAFLKKVAEKQIKTDSLLIANYLKEKNITAIRTESGLYYVVQKAGNGPLATEGKMASVHYAGFFLDGKLFDTSLAEVAKANGFDNRGRNEPYPVAVNKRVVIDGWDEMLLLMNKGMKVTVYVPSNLAYGQRGKGEIPPNTCLVFDMEVVDIK